MVHEKTKQEDCVTLYFREGSSDKVYQAGIEPRADGFVVKFAYGRRGSTLQNGSKTTSPVDYAKARKIFDKLVQEKIAKGYTPGEDGTRYQHTPNEDRATGIVPQLLNAIDEEQAQKLLKDYGWCAQEKFDGRRVLIRKSGDAITGINRNGLVIALPAPIAAMVLATGSQQWLMDGECIGDVFHCFDLLENACVDLRKSSYHLRLQALYGMMPAASGVIQSVATATQSKSKQQLLDHLREQKREGIVFKRLDAHYAPGRPNSGGDQLKFKFTATASCIVAAANGSRRSVRLELLDANKRIEVGNVTIPPRTTVPAAGQIVEIRYLYAYPGGSLYQPVYLGPRDDIQIEGCTIGQLKFKGADAEDDAA